MHKTFITAHAGAFGTQANTLHSIEVAAAHPAVDCIEVDVRFLPDGTPALGHNTVDEKSVKLSEMFALLQGYSCTINLDMKETTHLPRVLELVGAHGFGERAFFTGLREGELPVPGLPYYLNGKDCAAAAKFGAVGVNIYHKRCNKKLLKQARKLGLQVSVWTVDKPRHMRKMRRHGVDNITTRHPDVLAGME
ncbi:MAG: glycerophosphodiester phosphodiesterase [Oscillospiraceae bacterium]|nr:glycerophosphodiester phosphodiesterase [Oscillospiraceae bacterium]